jgi:hypothetical protein
MKAEEIKALLLNSLSNEVQLEDQNKKLEEAGVSYSFSYGFTDKVLERVFMARESIYRKVEFTRYMNLAFYRIALTGAAAIVLLLVSMYLMQGSLSFNSLLGLGDNYDESIICLLTQN